MTDNDASGVSAPYQAAHGIEDALPLSVVLAGVAFIILNTAYLPLLYSVGEWIVRTDGRDRIADFVTLWSAGQLVLSGHPAWVYDWDIAKQAQIAVTGQNYAGHFGFHYPPPFLFVVAALAKIPYVASFIGWVVVSFVPYAAMIRALVGRPLGWWLALAFPALFYNSLIGQNGCLTAALVGGTLLFLPARPTLAGICLGLLTYKPQYGLLFPLMLIATGEWRVIVSATVTAIAIGLASWLAFGSDTWMAFLHQAPMTSQAFLSDGQVYFGKMQSLFAFVRFLGGSEILAWTVHWSVAIVLAALLVTLWRSSARYELKAAALALGTVLATPYVFMYDLVVLAVPAALLVRLGLESGFRRIEAYALAIVAILLLAFYAEIAPVGLIAALILAGLVADRALAELRWAHKPDPAAIAA